MLEVHDDFWLNSVNSYCKQERDEGKPEKKAKVTMQFLD